MTQRAPIRSTIPHLRQRERSDGSWRVWWEPSTKARALGFEVLELDADRPSWSERQAMARNAELARKGSNTPRNARGRGGRIMSALIEDYRASRMWAKLSDGSRRSYTGFLNIIDDKWGHRLVAEFTKPMMQLWYEALATDRGVTMADRTIATISILFSHAELRGWRPENSNPCFRLSKDKVNKRSRVANWTELNQLVASADALGYPGMALAIQMAALQGQRQSDIYQAQVSEFFDTTAVIDGEKLQVLAWHLVRRKRSTEGLLPIHPQVEPRLRQMLGLAQADGRDHLIIDHATGRPYSLDLFQKRFAVIKEHARKRVPSIATLQFRDLRRTFGALSRMGHASRDDVGDVLGNSAARDFDLGDTYMPPSFEATYRATMAIQPPKQKGRKRA